MSNMNRNSVEKSDQEVMKHVCKLCNKGFPCGRSLGGHMRSHVINSTDQYHQNNNHKNKNKKKMKLSSVVNDVGNSMNSSDLGYELRKDPKKTHKAVVINDSNSDDFAVLDKLCKECGKGFQSWKALFGHMKCHSENSGANMNIPRIKKSKPRSRNVVTKDSSSDSLNGNQVSTSVVSDIVDDQEAEVAMCLIMLSKDVGNWGEKVIESGCKMKNLEAPESCFDDQSKRSFECATCNKRFHSYQALGGHKASHKKLKTDDTDMIKGEPVLDHDHMINGCCEKFNLGESLKNTMVVGAHECSICFRVFSSGQALGGHKRSHLIAEAKLNQQKPNLVKKFDEPVHEIRGSFDLNMLPDEEEQEIMMMNTSSTGYNPWGYNHESAVLGLLSTS